MWKLVLQALNIWQQNKKIPEKGATSKMNPMIATG